MTIESDEGGEISPAAGSAHAAAVAEGATAVQAATAEEAAGEAKLAAEVALSAAQANAETGAVVVEAAMAAEGSAQAAQMNAEMVRDALAAQTAAINVLSERLEAAQKQQAPPGAPGPSARPDREPGGKSRLVRR